ncbi:hypothetical protein HRbin29_02149 [bacterium HR29]|nr:hypothetical protein HRbin29_02149 [bacterium HR29]
MRLAVIGLPFFGERVAALLAEAGIDARFLPSPVVEPRRTPWVLAELVRSDLVYAIGSRAARGAPVDLLLRLGKKVVLHWAGSDVLFAQRDAESGRLSRRVAERAVHWAVAPWLVEELGALGIAAEERPLPLPIAWGEPVPLPETFRVLVYLPERPWEPYDVEGTLAVMRALPDVPFLVVGGYVPPAPLPNVEALGFVPNMAEVYRRTSVLLRLTHHDGRSHSVIEALSFGRYVVWTYGLPGVVRVSGPAEAAAAIARLRAEAHGLNERGLEEAARYRAEVLVPEAVERLRSIVG